MVVAIGSDLMSLLSASVRMMAGEGAVDADDASAGIGTDRCGCSCFGAAGAEWGSDFKVQTLKHA
ncbi:hypothetical protein D3C85_1449660 [compost metagenome]